MVPAAKSMWTLFQRIYLPELNAKNSIEIDAKRTELRRFKVAISTSFEKSDQEIVELGDGEALAEVNLQDQQDGNFLIKQYNIYIYVLCFDVSSRFRNLYQ